MSILSARRFLTRSAFAAVALLSASSAVQARPSFGGGSAAAGC